MVKVNKNKLSDYLISDALDIPEIELELAETTKDPDVMDKLSAFWDWRIRSRIAKKVNLNLDTLEKLSKDTDYLVRLSIIQNEATPINILQTLTHDADLLVKKCAEKALQVKLETLYSMWRV